MPNTVDPRVIVREISLSSNGAESVSERRGAYAEWLVTNGLGGYASGTVGGLNTRRFHGLLIAALPAPHARTMMANSLTEKLVLQDTKYLLSCRDFNMPTEHERSEKDDPKLPTIKATSPYLSGFHLEMGLPIWTFRVNSTVLEKRVCMLHQQNTTYISYRILEGGPARIEISPGFDIRPHEGNVSGDTHKDYRFAQTEHGFELTTGEVYPPLRLKWLGEQAAFHTHPSSIQDLRYEVERSRGYDWQGNLWSPGLLSAVVDETHSAHLVLSTEAWDHVLAVDSDHAFQLEHQRRRRLLQIAPPQAQSGFAAELVLAADQFLITPSGRTVDQVRAHALGSDVRSVIAGYHWFTDWGRDTMISLEGLTLSTGRWREAEALLQSFARHIHNGLIPNLFPEGSNNGLYHTADATLWFFHAVDRYVTVTGGKDLLRFLLPKLIEVIRLHVAGTDFGIHVDPNDGLLSQGKIGYQLTWMDAKVGDWVVTPRRGKAVELNALWYNALCLVIEWIERLQTGSEMLSSMQQWRDHCYQSFQHRFWNEKENCLFDVVDSLIETDGSLHIAGNDASIRPNQLLAISLKYPVLDASRWQSVLGIVEQTLLTPRGLRSLAPSDPNFKSTYDGTLLARDSAYHQGTVWGWLVGPFCNAWKRVHPDQNNALDRFLAGFNEHLSEDGIGTISEIFDATTPFLPRGCIAQAWSVAEVLRCVLMTHEDRK